jgi:serine/threonine-protein kinase
VRDLDAIVGKAMHKQAERRYASVAQLSEDLERWLEGQPVRARPDSRAYRVHTFLRRHPLGTAAGALLLLLLVAFAAAMAWQAERVARERDSARREARVAKETADFLIDLFGASDPRVADPANLRARDLLDAAAERLPTALASDPLARARLLHTIGLAFANMGDDTRGTALLADALALRKQHAGTDSSEVADSLNRLGNIHRQFGRLAEAEPMLLRALDWRTRNGPVDADLADSYNNLGLLQNDMGQYEEAESTLRRAIALHRQVAGDASNSVASPLHNLAIALRAQKRFEEARAAALESLQRKRSADERSASVANTLAVLANIERELGGLDAAVTHSSESLVLRRAVFGNDSLMIASGLITHAGVLAALERNAEAEALFDEALALHQRTGDADSAAAARTYLAYGRFLLARGSAPRALILIERAHAIVVAGLPPGAQVPASYAQALAAARLATGP